MAELSMNAREFSQFQRLIFDIAGINLSANKQSMVAGRLAKRMSVLGAVNYGDYFAQLQGNTSETQLVVDLLTTNETYFFREEQHFDFLSRQVLPTHKRGAPFRVWSAAGSSGEEAYTTAMVLAECLGGQAPWDILASDISLGVLERARAGIYPTERAKRIPPAYLKRHCLKGVRSQEGKFKIAPGLKERVTFQQINLNQTLPKIGEFDLVFLRNVMIYFSPETKVEVVRRVIGALKPGGYLFIGHSESLNGIAQLTMVRPAIYRKPGGTP